MVSSAIMLQPPETIDENRPWISQRVIALRKRIGEAGDWAGLPIGLTFMGFVFSVGTWHWWLEHKVGLYVWVLVVLATIASSLIAPDRDAAVAAVVFGSSIVSVLRIWDWLHGGQPAYVALLWILGSVALLGISSNWKVTAIAALGMWAIFSLKAVFLNQEPRGVDHSGNSRCSDRRHCTYC